MYRWLAEALASDASQVVTANRRLARTLLAEHARSQQALGKTAWPSPAIHSWRDWLLRLAEQDAGAAPNVRINAQQSRLLWEECLLADIDDPFIRMNVGSLARQCRDTWSRLHEWQLPLAECQAAARGQDQRIFARAAGRYADLLEERGWIDEALLPALLAARISAGELEIPNRLVLAGFDRITPAVEGVVSALEARECVRELAQSDRDASARLLRFESPEAELRSAGQWARTELDDNPDLKIAIVVNKLEQVADQAASLLREGFVPGWQYSPAVETAVNVSFGRALSDYPAIQAGFTVLRWLYQELRGDEIGSLLCSPFVGVQGGSGRSRLELWLRERPDRQWSRAQFMRAFGSRFKTPDLEDWAARWREVDEHAEDAPARMRPAAWAELLDKTLRALNWPGEGTLSSADFQLDNRWRELLNEFSRLELVTPTLTGAEAVARLSALANETMFQPESEATALAVLGPLEAAGLEFDKLWVSGLAAADWPPAGRPLALLSRDLQREHGMPDATPDDTAGYGRRVLSRLRESADDCMLSFPATVGDSEQIPTAILDDLTVEDGPADAGWHAACLVGRSRLTTDEDRVPPVSADETVYGGTGTIQRQITEPFSAFACGRLGVRWIAPYTTGIAANVRGSIVHDALFKLYEDKPSSADILAWSEDEVETRVRRALEPAFAMHERFADAVLHEVLRIERKRTARLLKEVIAEDRGRGEFRIHSLEDEEHASFGKLSLRLRHDRIDRAGDGGLVVLDYKTGGHKKFLYRGDPAGYQLVVYASVLDETITGLGLYNVETRHTGIDGVGPALAATDDWQSTLSAWSATVVSAARQIEKGDVRLNPERSLEDARPLNLLSRFAELRLEY